MRNGEGIDNGKKKKKKRNSDSNNRPNKQKKKNILHFADKCAQNYKKTYYFL